MEESLLYNGNGLFSGLDYPKEALGFFRAVGHTLATEPLIIANDVMHCIYSELNFATFFDNSERSAFLCMSSLSHLFTLESDVFYDSQSSLVRYYAISIDTPKSDRTTTANIILNAFAKNTKDFLVIMFQNEGMCMFAFAIKTYARLTYFSDWFDGSDVEGFVKKADIGNLSLKNGGELFSDFVYMTARSYYIRPLSKDYIHAEWHMLDEDERPSWNDYADEQMNENCKRYGYDYIDVFITRDYQTDNIEGEDFELDLLALELELEKMKEADAFELDESDYDDFDGDEEYDLERINTEDIPPEIMDDPVKLLNWLRKSEPSVDEKSDDAGDCW